MASRLPAGAFAPRVHPRVRMPDIYPLFARSLLEEQATRKLDYEAFFGELLPEVSAARLGERRPLGPPREAMRDMPLVAR
jgi:hypothetical protein